MGTLLEQLQSDVKSSMRARDGGRTEQLRMFVNALQGEAKQHQRDLTPDEEIRVLMRERKKRIESAEAYEGAGADDRAAAERAQAAMLDAYLPEPLTERELQEFVRSAISEVGATSAKDMGAVMQAVRPKVGNRADGKLLSTIVRGELTGQ